MNRVLGVFLGITLGAFVIAPVSAIGLHIRGTSGPNGVYCEINEVTLFALTEEDCVKAGGVVTHTVTTEVEQVERNQDIEPGNR